MAWNINLSVHHCISHRPLQAMRREMDSTPQGVIEFLFQACMHCFWPMYPWGLSLSNWAVRWRCALCYALQQMPSWKTAPKGTPKGFKRHPPPTLGLCRSHIILPFFLESCAQAFHDGHRGKSLSLTLAQCVLKLPVKTMMMCWLGRDSHGDGWGIAPEKFLGGLTMLFPSPEP